MKSPRNSASHASNLSSNFSYNQPLSLSFQDLSSLSLPALTSPDEFSSSSAFDLLSIFSSKDSKQRYRGDKQSCLTMISYPEIALRSIRRIQAMLPGTVGVHPISSCCINYGVFQLLSNSDITSLISIRHRFYDCRDYPTMPVSVTKILDSFLNSLTFDLPPPERMNVFLPEDVLDRLNGIAFSIGAKPQRLASLSLIYSLLAHSGSDREVMNREDNTEIASYVSRFYDSARTKYRAAKCLMDEFGVPELGSESAEEWKRQHVREM